MSGATSVKPAPAWLSRIVNAVSPGPSPASCTETCSTTAKGGGDSRRTFKNDDSAARSPSSRSSTPSDVLRAQPVSAKRAVCRSRNGRNPTPCTTPRTYTRTRCFTRAPPGCAPTGVPRALPCRRRSSSRRRTAALPGLRRGSPPRPVPYQTRSTAARRTSSRPGSPCP